MPDLLRNLRFLDPNLLWLAPLLLLLILLGSRWLGGLAPWRRRSAMLLQCFSVIALVSTVAQPVLVKPDKGLSVVLVLDGSDSVSDSSRDAETEYARAVLANAAPQGNVRFVVMAREAALLKTEDISSGKWGIEPAGAGGATDIAAGLRLAGSLLGDIGQRRVVLLTDGWETRGSAETEAQGLRLRGIDLRVVPLSALGQDEIIARQLDMAPYARVGDTVYSNLQVYSTGETSATLHISLDGGDAQIRQVTLKPGDNNLPLQEKAGSEGFHKIAIVVQGAADTHPENNTAGATLVVKPQPHVLILQDRDGEGGALSDALSHENVDTDIRYAVSVPPRASDLDEFDAVVLDNVAATSLTLDQQRTLQEYVRREGRGLVVTGGQTSFAKGGYPDTVLEDVLPVLSRPAPRPDKGATALVLVMDRSASMDDHVDTAGQFTKFTMAKDAARLAVDALRVGDTIGVLAFDTRNSWPVPVQKIQSEADKDTIKNLIANITIGTGTSIYPAVDESAHAIEQVDSPSKHLVLLTDGLDNGNERYEPIINGLIAQNVTLSTIGIGSDADKPLLTSLAKLGQGRYYFTEQPQNIPKIVLRELDLALKEATVEGSVQPHLLTESPLLRGLTPQELPTLNGYDITTAKPDSVLALVSDKGDPLLAHWNYGLGRVVAFTSQAGETWGDNWLSWSDFASFWSGAVRWSMASPINRLLQPSASIETATGQDGDDSTAHLSAESLNPDNTFADLGNVSAAVRSPSGVITNTVLSQVAPGRYEADMTLGEPGTYQAVFSRDGDDAESETAGFTVQGSPELMNAGTNDRLLTKLSAGKDFVTNPKAALDLQGLAASPELQPLWEYFLAPGLVLLFLSVLVRRLDFRIRNARKTLR